MQIIDGLTQKQIGIFYKHKAEGVNYPLNAPDDRVTGLNREEKYLDGTVLDQCIYRQAVPALKWNELNYNLGIERAIARLIAPDTLSGIKGYSGYGFGKDGCFYADYWDQEASVFNKGIEEGRDDFSAGQHQLFKIDQDGNIYACVVNDTGTRTKLIIDTKSNANERAKKHSPSGVIFAVAAYIVSLMKHRPLVPGDAGYEIANIVFNHYQKVCDAYKSAKTDEMANYLRCLDNDLYTIFRYEDYVKQRYDSFPFVASEIVCSYRMLSDTSFDMDIMFGHSSYLGGEQILSENGGYINEDDLPNKKKVKDIMSDPSWIKKYCLNPERVLTSEEELMVPHKDEMVPAREVLTKAELIKASTLLPRPFRNLLLTGETGSGKSTAAQIIAQMFNLPYCFIGINPDTIISDLYLSIMPATDNDRQELDALTASLPTATDIALDPAGSYFRITGIPKADASEADCASAIQDKYYELLNKANGFIKVESPLVQAFRYGWVCELQEINVANKPGVLSGINAALDDLATIQLPTGEVIKRHPDCVIIMTANVDYEGTRKINQAVKSRCALKGRLNLPEDSSLVEMVKLDSGYEDDNVIRKMIQAMKGIRKVLNETGTTDGSCGVREIVAWAQATKILGDPYRAAQHTILPSSTDDDEVLTEVIGAFENFFVKKTADQIVF